MVSLVHQQMVHCGLDRKALGDRLAEGCNRAKAFRRLDRFLQGEQLAPEFIDRLAAELDIPADQLAVAWEAQRDLEKARLIHSGRRFIEGVMERRGPHLWGRLPEKYVPSLLTILGPEHYLLILLGEEIIQLPHYEEMQEVGQRVREHYQHHRRCRLIGYDYRRSLHEVFRFDVDGEYLGRVDGEVTEMHSQIRIKHRNGNALRHFLHQS